jgi:hypothetical protein
LIDDKTVAEWITEAFHLVVFLRRDAVSGKRRVEEIIELTGSVEQGNRILNQPIFARANGVLVRTPYPLARAERLRERGVDPMPFAPTPRFQFKVRRSRFQTSAACLCVPLNLEP